MFTQIPRAIPNLTLFSDRNLWPRGLATLLEYLQINIEVMMGLRFVEKTVHWEGNSTLYIYFILLGEGSAKMWLVYQEKAYCGKHHF